MMHDFSLTEKYVVLYDLPVALDLRLELHNRPAKTSRTVDPFRQRHAAPDFFLRAAMRGSARGGGARPGCHTAGPPNGRPASA